MSARISSGSFTLTCRQVPIPSDNTEVGLSPRDLDIDPPVPSLVPSTDKPGPCPLIPLAVYRYEILNTTEYSRTYAWINTRTMVRGVRNAFRGDVLCLPPTRVISNAVNKSLRSSAGRRSPDTSSQDA
jgi:hypothetical protein